LEKIEENNPKTLWSCNCINTIFIYLIKNKFIVD
jgi:hypothetical protein